MPRMLSITNWTLFTIPFIFFLFCAKLAYGIRQNVLPALFDGYFAAENGGFEIRCFKTAV